MLYVFDEPSTGLHPLDVATLVAAFDRLLESGATIIVIDHDPDLLVAADHLIDMRPGGGRAYARQRGPWLAEHLRLPEPADVP